MNFVFVNHTTLLPIDFDPQAFFEKHLDKEFTDAFKNPTRFLDSYLGDNPIHFVDERDKDIEGQETDALGTYSPIDPDWRRPVIKVCPEKVFASVKSESANANGLSFVERFRLLIAAVTIHEVAHFLMDLSGRESNYPRVPLKWVIPLEWAIENKDKNSIFANLCPVREGLYNYVLKGDISWVEESLANAIMLKCFKGTREENFLKSFVKGQTEGYKASLNWNGTLEQTLETAKSFARFKNLVVTSPGAKMEDTWITSAGQQLNSVIGRINLNPQNCSGLQEFDFDFEIKPT
jgi:hypothetical protein